MKDLHKVLVDLKTSLAAESVGHSIAIREDLELKYTDGGGYADLAAKTVMTSDTHQDVLSMSKTITAAGTVHALFDHGLTPHAKITDHLPSDWDVDGGWDTVTFAHLLTHTSGLVADSTTYEVLETKLASPPTNLNHFSYQNGNFSLLRVLIGQLQAQEILDALIGLHVTPGVVNAYAYIEYIQKTILNPSGVTGASVGPTTAGLPTTKWYTDLNGTLGDQHMTSVSNPQMIVGADYWNMSVREYSRFIAHLTNDHLGVGVWPTMRDTGIPDHTEAALHANARLGCYEFKTNDGSTTYGHNGGWSDAVTGWMAFPGAITVVFFSNTVLTGLEQEARILHAWAAG